MTFKVPEKYRKQGEDDYGLFLIPRKGLSPMTVIANGSNQWHTLNMGNQPWEHVSVSTRTRCPTWEEMCRVKNLFWDKDDLVIQYHPTEEDYVNCHPYCLHLWRPTDLEIPKPPKALVGF